jgi:FMN phosphatase YigB (HAD superfamily)
MTNNVTLVQNQPIIPALHHKYKNIVFDVGAVLISWKPDEFLKNTFGDSLSPAISKYFENFSSGNWADLDRGTITDVQAIAALTKDLGASTANKLITCMVDHLTPLSDGITIFNEIKSRGYKTYILSNMSELCLQKIAAENDFVKQVDGAIWSYKVKCIKPEPQIYHELLREYSLKAEECIFIDDREENIKGAQALGIDGIVCKNHEYLRQELGKLKII